MSPTNKNQPVMSPHDGTEDPLYSISFASSQSLKRHTEAGMRSSNTFNPVEKSRIIMNPSDGC